MISELFEWFNTHLVVTFLVGGLGLAWYTYQTWHFKYWSRQGVPELCRAVPLLGTGWTEFVYSLPDLQDWGFKKCGKVYG